MFIYALVLASVLALGAGMIKFIHGATPELSGFSQSPAATADPGPNAQPPGRLPESVALMQSQGWVTPAALEIYEPGDRPNSELPPEIAAVPEVLMDTKPMEIPMQAELRPPPPDASAIFETAPITAGRSQLSLPPLRPGAPSDQAIIVQGDPSLPARPNPADQIGAVINGLAGGQAANAPGSAPQAVQNEQTQTAAAAVLTRPGAGNNQPASLEQAQSSCDSLGFISRIACRDRVRNEYCEGRWNRTSECARDTRSTNF